MQTIGVSVERLGRLEGCFPYQEQLPNWYSAWRGIDKKRQRDDFDIFQSSGKFATMNLACFGLAQERVVAILSAYFPRHHSRLESIVSPPPSPSALAVRTVLLKPKSQVEVREQEQLQCGKACLKHQTWKLLLEMQLRGAVGTTTENLGRDLAAIGR